MTDISARLFRTIGEIYFSILYLTSCLPVCITCSVSSYPSLSDPCLMWFPACLPYLLCIPIIWSSLIPVWSVSLPVTGLRSVPWLCLGFPSGFPLDLTSPRSEPGPHLWLWILEIPTGLLATHRLCSFETLSVPWTLHTRVLLISAGIVSMPNLPVWASAHCSHQTLDCEKRILPDMLMITPPPATVYLLINFKHHPFFSG